MNIKKLSPSQQLGVDIKAAKQIFENRFGEQTFVNVNLWLEFANEVKEYLKMETFDQVISFLKDASKTENVN